ncbi:MAG: Mov34/MPN/PAD-1 family protein [Chloroflexi bacterium]|nr:Mov34/MPN/PAD-1 family protein [Chloroflexota bacterium]
MFDNLVTYHIYRQALLPPSDALAYQYILAGNGLFIRAETRFFEAILPIAPCTVRGLVPLRHHFRLKVPRIPARLLDTILTDARRARRPDWGRPGNGLNEVLYQFHHHGQTVQVKKPPQRATGVSVMATSDNDSAILCDLHSHGNMRAFFSRTDDADEQATKAYVVIGKLDTEPEIRLRVGVYGYWQPLPVTAVFTGTGSFKDLYLKENKS